MKDNKTMSWIEYITKSIFYAFYLMIFYELLLFTCLENYTFKESMMYLWGMIILSIIVCGFIIYKKNRSNEVIESALIIPFGIYTILIYYNAQSYLINTVLLYVSVFAILSFLSIFIERKLSEKKAMWPYIFKRIKHTTSAFALGMMVIVFAIAYQATIGTASYDSNVPATTSEEQTIENNMEMLLNLREDEWVNLSTQEKLDVMQTVANIEANHLGLPNELNVVIDDLDENMLGDYLDSKHTIRINLTHLENDSAYDVLNTCCHEAYHSYQCRIVDAYKSSSENTKNLRIYKKAIQYDKEFNNYTDGLDDFESYYAQECESDARSYAQDAVDEYIYRIYDYILHPDTQ